MKTLLLTFSTCLLVVPVRAQYGGGSGTAYDPYQIWTVEQMNAIGDYQEDWDKCFVSVSNINMAGFSYAAALIAPDLRTTLRTEPATGQETSGTCWIKTIRIWHRRL
jgi:hypothetical protein